MDKLLAFKVFCLESYKSVHQLTGIAALDIFKKHRVFDYITSCYDVLHSNGRLYIVSDIDEYIKSNANINA
jgi:cyclopropane fatty-acyl-phospholipid synthase-like methyltransferase